MLGILILFILAGVAAIYGASYCSQLKSQLAAQDRELEAALERLDDINELLVKSEQQASLGLLVSSIAHEINTPVGICVTAASNLQDEVRAFRRESDKTMLAEEPLNAFLDVCDESAAIMHSNSQRASELIRSFKQIAVDQSSDKPRQINLKQYLDEILLSMHPKLKKTPHQVVVHCPSEIECWIHAGALAQVITNLIMNSLIHAFDEHKKGTIEINVVEANDTIHLSYSDDGKGLNDEEAKQIFTPFFTTKQNQGGSGLGTYLIHNLITHKLAGSISIKTNPGQGLLYIIDLPKIANTENI